MMIKGSMCPGGKIILNMHAPNNTASKFMKQNQQNRKEENKNAQL